MPLSLVLNYYGQFIPNLDSILYPLNELLRRDVEWVWSKECNQAFELADVLVISHVMSDRTERPIAFASKTLFSSEHYSQIEKEGLALGSRNFTLVLA